MSTKHLSWNRNESPDDRRSVIGDREQSSSLSSVVKAEQSDETEGKSHVILYIQLS